MLLSNPLASPYWPTLATAFFSLFGGSFIALLIVARGRWQVMFALPLFASLPVLFQQDVDRGLRRLTGLTFGLWYLPGTLSIMVLLARDPRGGPSLLLALCLGVALSDVGAFTFGRLWGRRAFAPRLSPSKTLAGLAGNVAGAALGLGLLSRVLPSALVFVPVVGVGAVWGDLLESLLKRAVGSKNAGQWLP